MNYEVVAGSHRDSFCPAFFRLQIYAVQLWMGVYRESLAVGTVPPSNVWIGVEGNVKLPWLMGTSSCHVNLHASWLVVSPLVRV